MALSFDGTGDYAQSSALYNNNAKVSVSLKVKIPSGASLAQYDRVFELGGYNTNDGGIGIEIDFPTSSVVTNIWEGGSNTIASLGSFAYTADEWFNIVVTSDTVPSSYVYYNGTQGAEITSLIRGSTQTQFTLAARNNAPAGNNDAQCDIAEVAIWHGVILDAAQAQSLSDGLSPLYYPNGLVGYYDLVDGRLINRVSSDSLTNTNGLASDPPRIFYPSFNPFIPYAVTTPVTGSWLNRNYFWDSL